MKAKEREGERERRVELGDEDDAERDRWRCGMSVNTRVTKGNQEQLFIQYTPPIFFYSCPFYRLTDLDGERRDGGALVEKRNRN